MIFATKEVEKRREREKKKVYMNTENKVHRKPYIQSRRQVKQEEKRRQHKDEC